MKYSRKMHAFKKQYSKFKFKSSQILLDTGVVNKFPQSAVRLTVPTKLLFFQILLISGAIAMGCCKPASSYELLLIGQLLSGVACGMFTGLVPLYVTEVSFIIMI
jgi:hypothetical protein